MLSLHRRKPHPRPGVAASAIARGARYTLLFTALAVAALLVFIPPNAGAQSKPSATPVSRTLLNSSAPPNAALSRTVPGYGALPLRFERNLGQASPAVRFLSVGGGYVADFENGSVGFVLRDAPSPKSKPRPKNAQQSQLWMNFAGARANAEPAGDQAIETVSNYYVGADPSRRLTGVPNYARVRYAALYAGVDLDFHGDQSRLEYDFTVSPHADPSNIVMSFRGATKIAVRDGAAILRARGGEVTFERPHIFQEAGGKREDVQGEFVRRGKNRLGFRLGPYDRSQALVIDPVLTYATYITGEGDVELPYVIPIAGLALDSAGEAVVAGDGLNFQMSQSSLAPIQQYAFVAKLNAASNGLIFSTLIGGNGNNYLNGMALDSQGGIYFTGFENQTDPGLILNYPTTPGAYSSTVCTNCEGTSFLTKLSPTGALVYSTYLSSAFAYGEAVATDANGDAYVAGTTVGTDMQIVGGFEPQGFAFVQEFDPKGQSLLYSTFFDGSTGGTTGNTTTIPTAIAVDGNGGVYVSGTTSSPSFPLQNPIQTSVSGAFLIKFTPTAGAIDYSTLLDSGATTTGMALDSSNNVYLAGTTTGFDFPVTQNSFLGPLCGDCGWPTVFVVKINPASGALLYSTLLGPTNRYPPNNIQALAVDGAGNAYLTGSTPDPSFPIVNAIEPTWPEDTAAGSAASLVTPAFVTELDSTGTPSFSTFLGGLASGGTGSAVAADSKGNVFVAGTATIGDFPVLNTYQNQAALCCVNALFVAKINTTSAGPVASLSPLQYPTETVLRNMGSEPLTISQITQGADFGGTCVAPITLNPGDWCFLYTVSSTVTVTSNSPSSPQVFSLANAVGGGGGGSLMITPGRVQFSDQLVGTVSPPQTFTLTSLAASPTTSIDEITSNPPYLQTNNCPAILAGGASCTVQVQFAPAANLPEPNNGGVYVYYDLQETPLTLPVSGFVATNAVTVVPKGVAFGTQYLGATPLPRAVTVTNVTDGPLTVQSLSLSNPAFTETDNCATPLAAQASCRILLSFQPTATGDTQGTLTIVHDSVGYSQTVQLNGLGAIADALTVSPSSLSFFGSVGNTTPTQNVSLKNATANPVNLTGYSIQPPDFSIAQNMCPASLPPSASCDLEITFTASASETITGSLTVDHSGFGPAGAVSLSGTTSPTSPTYLTAFPSPLIFADQELSTTSADADLSLGAQGGSDTITAISIDNPDFQPDTVNSCVYPLPHTFPAFIGCGIGIKFTPSALGQRTASLTITTTVEATPRVIPLVGNGVSTALEVNPPALQFPPQPIGLLGATESVTLTNVSGGALGIPSIAVTGPFSQSNNCGGSIAQAKSCTIQVLSTPTLVGGDSGVLSIQDSAEANPHTVALSGGGEGGALAISSANLVFLDQPVDTTSVAYPVTLTNNSSSAMAISSIATSGEFAQTNNCGSALPSASSCTINVTFTPLTDGLQSGTLTFSYGTPAVQQVITLSGTAGPPPGFSISPTSVAFGPVLLGGPGLTEQLFATNPGSGTLSINNFAFTNSAFSLGDNFCGLGIPAGESASACQIQVVFTPTTLGAISGSMQIYDTAAGSPQTISLSGQGTNFTLGTAADPVITESLPITVMFGMASSPNSTETVALSCSVSPASSYQCQLSQNSVLFTGGSDDMFTVTVSKTGSSSTRPGAYLGPNNSARWLAVLLAGCILLAWVALLGRVRRPRSAVNFAAIAIALALLLSLGLASCGTGSGGSSSGGGTQGGGGTPPNILTVTGTSSNPANPPQTVQLQFVPLQ